MKKLIGLTIFMLLLTAVFASCGREVLPPPQPDDSDLGINECAHEWSIETVKVSCTEGGYDIKICVLCGEAVSENEIEPLGHTYYTKPLYDEYCHWYKCVRCNDQKDVDSHSYDDGMNCSVCGMANPNMVVSEGLNYTSLGNGTCILVGMGSCTDGVLVIPETSPEGDTVIAIADYAFFTISGISQVVIPDSVISIGEAAFARCNSLTSIYIPENVSEIKMTAFCDSASLERITVSPENEYYCDIDGNLCSKDMTTFMQYAEGKGETTIVLPESITAIAEGAFAYLDTPTQIILHDGVRNIGWSAFFGCTSLTSIEIPEGVVDIPESVFYNCYSLRSVSLPSTLTHIGASAFEGCMSLRDVTYNGSISDWNNIVADSDNEYLLNANIVYSGNSGEVVYSQGLEFTSNGDGTCYVSRIGNCTDSYVVIPEYSPLGELVVMIGQSAFYRCDSIRIVVIPNTVTVIGRAAFARCGMLESVFVPASVELINDGAFCDSPSLVNICVSVDNNNYCDIDGNLYSKDGRTLIQYAEGNCDTTLYIQDGVTKIGYGAVAYVENLVSVVIPDGVEYIDTYAFLDCTSLASVTIPKSVISIGEGAFAYNTMLADVYYGGSNEEWNNIFFGRDNDYLIYANIHCNDVVVEWHSRGLDFVSNGDGTCYVSGIGYCTDVDIAIPRISPEGELVVGIGDSAFAWCESINSVIIPESVTYIGENAFWSCNNMTVVIIPESVTSIGKSAFLWCHSLESIDLPYGLITIGDSAFNGCGFISLYIPESVISIGANAFWNCTGLTDVFIPSSVESIGECAFDSCFSLSKIEVSSYNSNYCDIDGVLYSKDGKILIQYAIGKSYSTFDIPYGVTTIGKSAFYYCDALVSVTIPETVTSIEASAFYFCQSLTSVVIPEGVTYISSYAFSWCTSLASVTIPASVIEIHNYAFDGCDALVDVYYKGSLAQWNLVEVEECNDGLLNSELYYDYTPGALYSDGLAFEAVSFNECYVVGIGSCTDENVRIPLVSPNGYRVVGIADHAFDSYSSILSVVIPTGVTYIGEYAFCESTSLTYVVIPDTVNTIGRFAFTSCTSLADISVSSDNEYFCDIGGSLYSKDGSVLIQYAIGKTDNYGSFVAHEGLVEIGDYAFLNCTTINNICLSPSVERIGCFAFANCTSLNYIQARIGLRSIAEGAVYGCDSLMYIFYSGSVSDMGNIEIDYTANDILANVQVYFNYNP